MFYDGNALLKYCRNRGDDIDQGVCLGVMTAYFEAFSPLYSCSKVGPNITKEQVRDVGVKFLEDNPSDRHLPGMLLAFRAFFLAFDCKRYSN